MTALHWFGLAVLALSLIKIAMIVVSINNVKPPEIDPDIVEANNKAYDDFDED